MSFPQISQFSNVKGWIVEKRHPDGTLDLTGPQPASIVISEEEVYRLYFNAHPKACTVSPQDAGVWWLSTQPKGTKIRPKTW